MGVTGHCHIKLRKTTKQKCTRNLNRKARKQIEMFEFLFNRIFKEEV